MTLSFSKLIVIRRIIIKVRGRHYRKLIDSRYRYRYHNNAIIIKDILPLVGIDVLPLLELVLLIAGTMWSFYSCSPSSNYSLIPYDSHISVWLTFKECSW